MSDKVITIAIFSSTIHAQYAKNSLEEAGISVFLTGENTVASSALQPLPIGNIRVQVFEADQKTADEIIAQVHEELKKTMETPMELEDETWERETTEPEADAQISQKESFVKRNRGLLIALTVVLLFFIWELKSGIFSGGPGDKEVTFTIELKNNPGEHCDINTASLILIDRLYTYGFIERNIDIKVDGNNLLIHLSDVDDVPRISRLLTRQGKLGFWETYENREVYPWLTQMNSVLGSIAVKKAAVTPEGRTKTKVDTTKRAVSSTGIALLDRIIDSSSYAIEIGEVTDLGRAKIDNPLFSIFQPAIGQDETGHYIITEGPVVGYVGIADTAEINSLLKLPAVQKIFPRTIKFLYAYQPYDDEGKYLAVIAIKVSSRDGSPPIGNYAIEDARQDYGQQSNRPEISMDMNEEGAETWRQLTRNNVGKAIAIVVDNRVISYPNITMEIAGGRSSISGDFTVQEARDLANMITSPPLPCAINLVDTKVVEAQ